MKIKVLSFQSEEVYNLLKEYGAYYSKPTLVRENRNYSKDVEQLGGANPIWCFCSTKRDNFITEDFNDGALLERFRCEMSLDQDESFSKLVLLELEIEESLLHIGKTHNAYDAAMVTAVLNYTDLVAAYRLVQVGYWYFNKAVPIEVNKVGSLFGAGFSCYDEEDWKDYLQMMQVYKKRADSKKLESANAF